MNTKFKVGDEVICTYQGDDCWYKAGDRLIISSEGFPAPDAKGLAYNIEGEYENVWIDGFDFQLVVKSATSQPANEYSLKHYDNFYHLTEQDIKEGKIRVDAYWVAKQWRTGSRDDSGALWHSLKTIARFGEKNSVEREIKALYNQARALARIYGVTLE